MRLSTVAKSTGNFFWEYKLGKTFSSGGQFEFGSVYQKSLKCSYPLTQIIIPRNVP